MTVCIAAVCKDGNDKVIITCTDGRSSNHLGRSEYVLKDRHLTKKWRCLTSGTESDILALLPLLKAEINALQVVDETTIKPALEAAVTKRKRQISDSFTGLKWGMSFSEFLKCRGQFPEDDFKADLAKIADLAIGANCIVAGFLDDGLPMLLHVHSFGVDIRDNFAVAGDGASLADASLLHRQHYETDSLNDAAYHVMEAKCYAERNITVGTTTLLGVTTSTGNDRVLTDQGDKYLRSMFAMFGPKEVPTRTINLTPEHFHHEADHR